MQKNIFKNYFKSGLNHKILSLSRWKTILFLMEDPFKRNFFLRLTDWPSNRQTDGLTTRLLELLWAAKNNKWITIILDYTNFYDKVLTPNSWRLTFLLLSASCPAKKTKTKRETIWGSDLLHWFLQIRYLEREKLKAGNNKCKTKLRKCIFKGSLLGFH